MFPSKQRGQREKETMKVLVRIHAGRNFVSYFFILEASFIAEVETIHWGSQGQGPISVPWDNYDHARFLGAPPRCKRKSAYGQES